jgi:hypothetical protein
MDRRNTNPTPAVLQLHGNDNVVICVRSLAAAEQVVVGGAVVCIVAPLGIGHKLASRDIREGEDIVKYGIVIGNATANIPRGGHVHTHNMKSGYIATYLIEE